MHFSHFLHLKTEDGLTNGQPDWPTDRWTHSHIVMPMDGPSDGQTDQQMDEKKEREREYILSQSLVIIEWNCRITSIYGASIWNLPWCHHNALEGWHHTGLWQFNFCYTYLITKFVSRSDIPLHQPLALLPQPPLNPPPLPLPIPRHLPPFLTYNQADFVKKRLEVKPFKPQKLAFEAWNQALEKGLNPRPWFFCCCF